MSIMHSLLEGFLRFAGRHQDANEVAAAAAPEPIKRDEPAEEIPLSDSLPEPALHASPSSEEAHDQGGSRDSSSSESTGAPSGGSTAPEAVSPSAPAGGASSAHGGSVAGSGDEESSESASNEHASEAAPDVPPAAPLGPEIDLLDPLSVIYSDHLRESIERDAFASASSLAQDSEIARAARLLPPELSNTLAHDIPVAYQNATSAERAARIVALRGDMPGWAKKDLEREFAAASPVTSSAASQVASRDASSATLTATLRESLQSPAKCSAAAIATTVGRAVTASRAVASPVDSQAPHVDAQPPSHRDAQPASRPAPAKALRAADSEREM